ncbi:MAG: BON domain-containing protein [Limnothrix sp.]
MNTNSIFRGEYTDSRGYVHREYEDAQGHVYTEYRDSAGNLYVYDRPYDPTAEGRLQAERESRAQSNGVLIGILIVALGSLFAGIVYLLTRPTPPDPLQVINVESSEPEVETLPSEIVVEQPDINPNINVEAAPQPDAPDVNVTTNTPAPQAPPSAPSPVVVVSPPPAGSSSTPSAPQASTPSAPEPSVSSPANAGVTDSALKTNITKQLKDKWPDNQLGVEVQNGVVTVSGQAKDQAQLDQIEKMLDSMTGVKGMMIKATAS